MWCEAIELGVSSFLAMREADEGTVEARLAAVGIAPWLARRLVVWLPIAFGRALLRDAPFTEDFGDGGPPARLADDPIYRAAAARARRMTRDEVAAIALRSCEVSAVNAFLNDARARGATAALSDVGAMALALPSPLPPIEEGDGGLASPRAVLASLLAAHGYPVEYREGTAMRVGDVDFDARVFPRWSGEQLMLQVDFVARGRRIATDALCESFAGVGPTYSAAVVDALRKFERGSFHVIVASLFDPTSGGEQVSWESWPHPTGPFRACLGAQLVMYGGVDHAPMGDLVDALRDALRDEPLTRAVHALRLFTAWRGDVSLVNEVLLDNEPWPAGEALSRDFPWPASDRLWGTRFFAMLAPL
jgi:hypothetical protein